MKLGNFHGLWNPKDAERGILWGLIVGTIYISLVRFVDGSLNASYYAGNVPYGALWVWLNPFYGTQLPYKLYTMGFLFAAQAIMWYFFVRKGRVSKLLFYSSWFINVIWIANSAQQDITVTAFAPLISVYPILVLFPILQKLPVGWSLNLSDPHWTCAFNTAVRTPICTNIGGRLLYIGSGNFIGAANLILVFWCIFPIAIWWLARRKLRGESAGGLSDKNECKCSCEPLDDWCTCWNCKLCYGWVGLTPCCKIVGSPRGKQEWKTEVPGAQRANSIPRLVQPTQTGPPPTHL